MPSVEFCHGAEEALKSMMGALRVGNGVDFGTPLIPHGISELQKEVKRDKIAQSIFDFCGLDSVPEPLRALEIEKKWKHWGNSARRPPFVIDSTSGDSFEKQVQGYFDPLRPRCTPQGEAMLYAIGVVRSLLQSGQLCPLDLEDAAQMFEKSGMGFPVVSSDPAHFNHVLAISRKIWDSGATREWVAELPAIAGYRGQPRGRLEPTDARPHWYAKNRLIYMMPRVTANLEKTIQRPLFDALSKLPAFCAWRSPLDVELQMTRLLSEKSRVLSLDFKDFDKSVPFEVIDIIFDIIRDWFVGEASELVEYARHAFKFTGIITPGFNRGDENIYYVGAHRTCGVPSGSVNTNMIDSLANILVMHYAAHKCGTRVRSFYPQGDDGVYTFTREVRLEDLSRELSTDLGMTLSVRKTVYEVGQVHFCQNLYSSDFMEDGLAVGMRPIMHLASAMTSYERVDVDDWKRVCDTVRWLQQIGQGYRHPRCTEMCDWLYNHDWCIPEIIRRVQLGDTSFVDSALRAVSRKDSALRFWGNAPGTFLSSPVLLYLGERDRLQRSLKSGVSINSHLPS